MPLPRVAVPEYWPATSWVSQDLGTRKAGRCMSRWSLSSGAWPLKGCVLGRIPQSHWSKGIDHCRGGWLLQARCEGVCSACFLSCGSLTGRVAWETTGRERDSRRGHLRVGWWSWTSRAGPLSSGVCPGPSRTGLAYLEGREAGKERSTNIGRHRWRSSSAWDSRHAIPLEITRWAWVDR